MTPKDLLFIDGETPVKSMKIKTPRIFLRLQYVISWNKVLYHFTGVGSCIIPGGRVLCVIPSSRALLSFQGEWSYPITCTKDAKTSGIQFLSLTPNIRNYHTLVLTMINVTCSTNLVSVNGIKLVSLSTHTCRIYTRKDHTY